MNEKDMARDVLLFVAKNNGSILDYLRNKLCNEAPRKECEHLSCSLCPLFSAAQGDDLDAERKAAFTELLKEITRKTNPQQLKRPKVGDSVRVCASPPTGAAAGNWVSEMDETCGKIGRVIDQEDKGNMLRVEFGEDQDKYGWWYDRGWLNYVAESPPEKTSFEVGDKVRVKYLPDLTVKPNGGIVFTGMRTLKAGEVGTVIESEDEQGDLYVSFSSPRGACRYYYYKDWLEHI